MHIRHVSVFLSKNWKECREVLNISAFLVHFFYVGNAEINVEYTKTLHVSIAWFPLVY